MVELGSAASKLSFMGSIALFIEGSNLDSLSTRKENSFVLLLVSVSLLVKLLFRAQSSFILHFIFTSLCVSVKLSDNCRFLAIIQLSGSMINLVIVDDRNTSNEEFTSIHFINPSDIGQSLTAVPTHIFSIFILIEGSEYKATVSPPLLK
ncbi:MAG: hypothetical protein BWY04_00881 [candidate division CPR1 bacterium ADurb.Bin160]|uniref:Uncharacterized protein n=1 Tax=candidate division CPR1 bacterium ADurb.Bin160 TaxID=1852826 RepID=A0A1V5ZMD3_9BACT|nr:MAG: hypothetical protein BWY04_00881 [candidate division CPR1 bacterium ADurb.Bin160]